MAKTFECPNCHAALDYAPSSSNVTVRCDFCNSTVIVPESLRPFAANADIPNTPMLDADMQTLRLHEIMELVRSGRKIEAIKLFRETFHVGLREAKMVVDQMGQNESVWVGVSSSTSVQSFGDSFGGGQAGHLQEIINLAHSGRKIEAIKLFRETFNVGLAEAKAAVEKLEQTPSASMGGQAFSQSYNPVFTDSLGNPINQSSSRGGRSCFWSIFSLFFVLILGALPFLLAGGAISWFESGGVAAIIEPLSQGTIPAISIPNIEEIVAPSTPIPTATPQYITPQQQFGGQEGIGPGFFDDTRQIGVDAKGNIFTGDYTGGRIQHFSSDGTFMTMWNAGDLYLVDMAVDQMGTIYIPARNQLLRFEGSTGQALPPFTYPVSHVTLRGVAAAFDGSIIAANSTLIVIFNADGEIIREINDPFGNNANIEPETITVDAQNHLYFLSGNDVVHHYDAQGNFINRFGSNGNEPGQFQGTATAVAVDGQGFIYVEHFGGIAIFANDGRFVDQAEVAGIAFQLQFNNQNQLVRMDRNGNQVIIYTVGR